MTKQNIVYALVGYAISIIVYINLYLIPTRNILLLGFRWDWLIWVGVQFISTGK